MNMRSSGFDVDRARRETPGCEHVLHFNNAGAALIPEPVLQAELDHLQLEAQIGAYEAQDRQLKVIDGFYDSASRLLGCSPDEIAFTSSATRAWDMAFYAFPLKPGDRILTARAEYVSNYIAFLQKTRKTGVTIEAVPSEESGELSIDALRAMIDDRVKLIAITHVPTNGGLVNPAEEIGRVAKEAGIPFLLDACQSIGQMPLDVGLLGCDILSATGRKFLRGPRATGLLYVRKSLVEQLDPPFLDMHSATWVSRQAYTVRTDAQRFEEWEQYYAGKIGLAAAIDYAMSWGLDRIRDRVFSLADSLRAHLADIPGVTVHDIGKVRCGIVTFQVSGTDAKSVKRYLAERKTNVTVSEQAFTRLDMEARNIKELIRASVHYYNTEEEIDRFCSSISRWNGK
jgi:selenocysteine lyase/cysteine desulfurase